MLTLSFIRERGFSPQSLPSHFQNLLPIPVSWDSFFADFPEFCSESVAAVAMLFLRAPHESDPSNMVFIKRSEYVRTHRGQIGFVGGLREYPDEAPADTASREVFEEIGISKDHLHFFGALPAVRALNGMPVLPLVGLATIHPDLLVPNYREVAEILFSPWVVFKEPLLSVVDIYGVPYQTNVYYIGDHKVWGLTARIIQSASLL